MTTTNNAVNTSLSGQTGTGNFVGSTSPTLVTPTLGAASATSITFSSTSGIIGTTTNNDAAAGSVGQFVSSTVVKASAISLSNGTAADVTSITIGAGDWDVWGNVTTGETGSNSGALAWISTTSATTPDASLVTYQFFAGAGSNNQGMPIVRQRYSVNGSTTIYLSCISYFSTGTADACGNIFARRVR